MGGEPEKKEGENEGVCVRVLRVCEWFMSKLKTVCVSGFVKTVCGCVCCVLVCVLLMEWFLSNL